MDNGESESASLLHRRGGDKSGDAGTRVAAPTSVTSDAATKKKVLKPIPMFGSIKERGKLLRNSNNLRFKELYKPIEPIVLFCAIGVGVSIWAFLHYVVHVPHI